MAGWLIITEALRKRGGRPLVETDQQLLARYVQCRDETAFEALVRRHADLVYGVCRRVLRHDGDSEDAFQATFLVLLERAGSIRRGTSLPGWLHKVALHIALRTLKQTRRRSVREQQEMTGMDAVDQRNNQRSFEEISGILDQAVAQLAEKQRAAIVLCCLEGRTSDEAATELGCSRSTVTRLLKDGRDQLRGRLSKLGITLSAATLATLLESQAAAAAPSAAIAKTLCLSAGGKAAAASATVAALAKAEVWGMALAKLKIASIAAASVAGIAGITVWVATVMLSPDPEARNNPAGKSNAIAHVARKPVVAERQIDAVIPKKPAVLKDQQEVGLWDGPKFRWEKPQAELVQDVNFSVEVPAGHNVVTVAMDDTAGVRVRNLLDAVPIELLGGKPNATEPQQIAVNWNGLNDAGQLLPTGKYRVRGLSHPGIKLSYDYSFFNPGTPPWEHYKNSGWGGDHVFPGAIACLRGTTTNDWKVVIGGTTAEGGSPGFVLNGEDRKVWAFGRGWSGPTALASSDGLIWVSLSGGKDLQRLEVGSGKNIPFATPTGAKAVITFDDDPRAIAVGKIFAAVWIEKKNEVLLLNKQSGEIKRRYTPPTPGCPNGLAFDPFDQLYVATDGGLLQMGHEGEPRTVVLPGLEQPGPCAVDGHGLLYVLARKPRYQVNVYSPQGKLLRAIGTAGGQQGLRFDPAALHKVDAIAVDDAGQLWASECGAGSKLGSAEGIVRRIAVWKPDGSFDRDFVGNTTYGATNTALHDQDPTLAFAYGVLYRLDPNKLQSYQPERYVSSGPRPDSPFSLWPGAPWGLFPYVRIFRDDASGKMREYLLYTGGFPILFQEKEGDYRPIVAIGTHETHPAFPTVADQPRAVFIWSDQNGDEQVQLAEMQHVPGGDPQMHYPWCPGLAWYVNGHELKPVRFNQQGIPIYNVKNARQVKTPWHGIPVGKHLVTGYSGPGDVPEVGWFLAGHHIFTDLAGNWRATHRANWPGVHASHNSNVPTIHQTGQSVGELFYTGTVDSGSDVGHVYGMQGNMGQAFLWSEEGLFVAKLFKDTRQSPQGYGDKEIKDADWTNVSMYGECFGGWFGKQDDGKVRYLFGRNAAHVVQVQNLELAKRFDAGFVTLPPRGVVSTVALKNADSAADLRVPRGNGRHPVLKADGESDDWKGIERHEIKLGDERVASVALTHDLKNLYLLWEVTDRSPALNGGSDPATLFKTGDAVDLMLGPVAPDRDAPIAGDLRLLLAPTAGKPTAMLYRPVAPSAPAAEKTEFKSPARTVTFDSVVAIPEVEVVFKPVEGKGYVCEARVPFDKLGLTFTTGLRLKGDLGVLSSNDGGQLTERRVYLFNKNTNIVSDIPSEAELQPGQWGQLMLD